jgi:transcriptional regulator with XRE-family HTH domain
VGPVSVSSIGEYIRQQREQAKISLRQLASAAGVSNPYLSQIERGLRRPSAEILQQIAKGLRISAEALYVQAGILEDRRTDSGVRAAVLADPELAERQKQVLLEIYESFRRESVVNAAALSGTAAGAALDAGAVSPDLSPRSAGARREPKRARQGAGDTATEDRAGADKSRGNKAVGDKAVGNKAGGDKSTGNEGAGGRGRRGTGRKGAGTGPGSQPAPGTGPAPQTVRRTGNVPHAPQAPDGTDEKSSGAEAPAHNARGPAVRQAKEDEIPQ